MPDDVIITFCRSMQYFLMRFQTVPRLMPRTFAALD
jgi:hypothetical protein